MLLFISSSLWDGTAAPKPKSPLAGIASSRTKRAWVELGFAEGTSKNYGGFLKWGYPQIIHFSWIFHYKPSSHWGTTMTMETP